jgi:hypothetical protein
MDPRARHVTYMQITGRKYPQKIEPLFSKLPVLFHVYLVQILGREKEKIRFQEKQGFRI